MIINKNNHEYTQMISCYVSFYIHQDSLLFYFYAKEKAVKLLLNSLDSI